MKDKFMNSSLVSVVIPTYNRAEFLREAIASVLAQAYQNFELLILDNCSPDHTSEVVASFKDHRIKYLRHQCNIHSLANWSYGVYWAKGEYLSILGDDDRYKADFLARRVAAMDQDIQIVSAFGPFEFWDGGSELSGHISTVEIDVHDSRPRQGLQALRSVLNMQFVGASMYRTSAVHAVWERALAGGKCSDELLGILLVVEGGKVVCLPESDLLYRRHAGQDMSMNMVQIQLDGVRMYKNLMEKEVDKQLRHLFKRRLVMHTNRIGRMHWNLGNPGMSARFFLEELRISPTRFLTWLRLLRCYAQIQLGGIKK